MLKVGLTGCMGSGKDAVADILNKHQNVKIIDSDAICRWLWENNENVLGEVREEFGIIDKKAIGKIVFDDAQKRKAIEVIFQPRIDKTQEDLFWQYENLYDIVLLNSPLLIETGNYRDMDVVISVITDREKIIERLAKRDTHLTIEDFEKRLALQSSDIEKIKKSDYVISNNAGLRELDSKTNLLYNIMLDFKKEKL